MEITLISDNNITTIDTTHINNSTFTTSLTRRRNFTLSSHTHRHEIQSQMLPIDAVAPPPVKPTTIPKSRLGKRSRVRQKRKTDGFGANEGGDGSGGGGGFFGDGGDGPFGGGGSGGGNFGWDESSSPADPAFDFVYEALSWFVLSNCLYFAFKRVVRIVVDGSGDPGERRLR